MEVGHALVVAAVEIVERGQAELDRGLAHGVQHPPGDTRRLDAPATARTVMFAVSEEVVFQAPEGRQYVAPAPAGQAKRAPAIVVGCLTAHADHGVDGGGASQYLAARIGYGA